MSDKTTNFATNSSEMPENEKALMIATLHILEDMGYKVILSISKTERIPFEKKELVIGGIIMSAVCPASQIKDTHDVLCDMMGEGESNEEKSLKEAIEKFFKMAKEN